jgi:hypothetical protein
MGLLVANLDKIQPHLAKGWYWPVFGFALASAVWGIVIQILWGFIQFSMGVENQIFTYLLPRLSNPGQFGVPLPPGETIEQIRQRNMSIVVKEFVESRPWVFRELAEGGAIQAQRDIIITPKTASRCAQMSFAFLIFQHVLLGAAIFYPFVRIR